ncbi:MAG: ribosome rescue protein RqcH [Candidatus Methanoperedens sp.]|nr:ribosome rescue protein RqcH [Candidatus Methanoperedens sp.]MCZ7371116.1 ribosome rescue protein RqcH [Candidatus Methanoperedens sp.]
MKQEMSSVDVAALIKELRPRLLDAKIAKIYQHSPDEVRIGLHIFKEGRTNLVIEAGRRLHLTAHPEVAQKLPQSFPMLLRKHLSGGRITEILQYDFDRIIEIHVQRGEDKTILLIELFSKGNIILLDAEKRIILPLKSISFRDRRVVRGETYELPQAQLSPITAKLDELKEIFSQSDSDIVRTVATRMNMGGQYAEEICLRAGIDKGTPAREISDAMPVLNAIQEVFKPLTSDLKSHIVFKDGKAIDVLPLPLSQYEKHEKKYFNTFNEALDEYFGAVTGRKAAEAKEVPGEKKPEKPGLYEYRMQKQMLALGKFKDEEEKLVHRGELIYAHYQICDGILKAVKSARDKGYSWDEIGNILKNSDMPEARAIKSINPVKGTINVALDGEEVELDIKLTVNQNSQVHYDKSKKLSSKIKGALSAIEETKKLSGKKEAPEIRRKTEKPRQKWFEQFRWFISSDGFLVIGGRDAQSNEDIVKKYLEKRDIFFHAHVSGSPAVLVKTEGKEVPDTTLLEAAQFTVSYSGIWKSGQASGDAYWVLPEQVSKTPESGEYVAKGAFVIRGKRNYFKDVILGASLGIIFNEEKRLIGGPLSAVKKRAELIIEIEPGEFNQNDLSKKIYRMLYEKFEDKKLIKTIASPDRIAMFLPPGGSRMKE